MRSMRDTLVTNPNYFDEFIRNKDSEIQQSKELMANGAISEENMAGAKNLDFRCCLERLIAHYSKGTAIDEIKKDYPKLVKVMAEGWDDSVVKFAMGRPRVIYNRYYLNEYCYMVWMLSLAVLLRVSEEDFNILKSLVLNGNIDDELILFLLNVDMSNSSKPRVKPFKFLLKKDIQQTDRNHIKRYLEKWYERTKLLTWHGYHPDKDIHPFYYGRWSFESAVIVALLDLDDTKFRDNQYYPKDLVDYYRAHG